MALFRADYAGETSFPGSLIQRPHTSIIGVSLQLDKSIILALSIDFFNG